MDSSQNSFLNNCNFCDILKNFNKTNLILSQALFNKYSSSQDYLYGQTIQKFMEGKSSEDMVEFRDKLVYTEIEEHMRKIYPKNAWNPKITYLSEYYKFHKEIPRMFMKPGCSTLNCKLLNIDYHDKMRKIEYYRIKKMLHDQKETDTPFQITQDSQELQQESSDSSNGKNQNMTKMLQSHLLTPYNDQIKNIQTQKTKIFNERELDTIQEINLCLKDQDPLDFKDAEQQYYFYARSYFLQEKFEEPMKNLSKKLIKAKPSQDEEKTKKISQTERKPQLIKDFQQKFNNNILRLIKEKIQNQKSSPKKVTLYQETLNQFKTLRTHQQEPVQNKPKSIPKANPVKSTSNSKSKRNHIRSPTQIPVLQKSIQEVNAETQRQNFQAARINKLKGAETYKSLDLNNSKTGGKNLSKELSSLYKSIKQSRKVHSNYDARSLKVPCQNENKIKIYKPQTFQSPLIQPKKKRRNPLSMQLSPDYVNALTKPNPKPRFDNKTVNKDIKFLFEKSKKSLHN